MSCSNNQKVRDLFRALQSSKQKNDKTLTDPEVDFMLKKKFPGLGNKFLRDQLKALHDDADRLGGENGKATEEDYV